jgi:HicB family
MACKRIIDGKTYNTETATELAGWTESPDEYPVTYGESLYQNRFGAFFLHSFQDDGPDGPEEDLKPLSAEEARAWLEKNQRASVIEAVFGKMPEAGSGETKFTLRMPDSLHKRLTQLAKADNQSLNAWIVRFLESGAGVPESDQEDIPPMGGLVGSNRTGWRTRGT